MGIGRDVTGNSDDFWRSPLIQTATNVVVNAAFLSDPLENVGDAGMSPSDLFNCSGLIFARVLRRFSTRTSGHNLVGAGHDLPE